ncbi:dihydrofolate reductase family protein [Corynebacterium sp. NPDC060344]|uniref:dihydrofolate reductase family protein n=1 Tax=Corynebacterium sp. NPDC060344 TaxID=3347101 RepID=UPI00365043D3
MNGSARGRGLEWFGDIGSPAGAPELAEESPVARFVGPFPGVTLIAVTSLDGRGAIDGVSGGLGNPADAAVLAALRSVSDVVVVGAGTARAENYGPATAPTRLAVLSRSLDIAPDSRLFDDPSNPPLILHGGDADPDRREALVAAGAELIGLPGTGPDDVIGALRELGHSRIALEGGPGVYRQFLAADAVDRAFLTLSPMVVGAGPATLGSESSVAESSVAESALASALPLEFRVEAAAFSDSHLFVRYSRGCAG